MSIKKGGSQLNDLPKGSEKCLFKQKQDYFSDPIGRSFCLF